MAIGGVTHKCLVVQKWLSEAGISSVMDSFDQDKSGGISFDEFTSLVCPPCHTFQSCLLHASRKNPAHEIIGITSSYTGLLQARAGALLDGKFLEYREAWQKLAGSENGTLGASQIQQVFKNLGNPLSENKLWKIFDRYDTDKNGRIDFPEFLELFRDELLDLHTILEYLEMNPLQQVRLAPAKSLHKHLEVSL
jgi:Ca2+-binding EF-hand superfamily protein